MKSIFVTGYVNILDGRKRVFSIFSINLVITKELFVMSMFYFVFMVSTVNSWQTRWLGSSENCRKTT